MEDVVRMEESHDARSKDVIELDNIKVYVRPMVDRSHVKFLSVHEKLTVEVDVLGMVEEAVANLRVVLRQTEGGVIVRRMVEARSAHYLIVMNGR
jgi:hypothetical protein